MPIKQKNAELRKKVETKKHLDSILSYNPGTGEFVWKGRQHTGRKAGWKNPDGYIIISTGRKDHYLTFKAHRLAWIMYYGTPPPFGVHIDHINGIRDDNRISNLRICHAQLNSANSKISKNNSTGYKGVSTVLGKYRAYICFNRRQLHLGCYDTPEDAHMAYVEKAKELFGEYHNPG